MLSVTDIIPKVLREIEAAKTPMPEADDEAVVALIQRIATNGYRPSEQIISPLRAYSSGYALLLSGDAGVGKTFLMRCLGVRLYVCDTIIDYGIANLHKWYSWTDGNDLCIDDLGSERIVAEYGQKDDVLKAVISHRCDWQGRKHGKTHVTTNLTAEQIAARYGDRTLSRLLGMCKAFVLTGENRREAKPQMEGG